MFIHEIINQAPSDHVAIEGDERVTYGELRNLVSLYRNQLYEMGIRRGMKVGLYSANRAEFIYVHLAVISLGAVIIPINNSLVDREVDYILKDGEASLLVTDMKLSVSIPSVDIHDLDFQARQRKASEAPAFSSDLCVYLRHHRQSQGRHADPPESGAQCGAVHPDGNFQARG